MSRGMVETPSDVPTAPESIRATNAARTRRKLVAAATELFAEQGLTRPSLDAICARAGFTRGAFYVHFKTREDLIVAVVEQVMRSFIDAITAVEGADADLATTITMFTTSVEAGAVPFPGRVRPHQILEACARSEKLRVKYSELLHLARERLSAAVRRGQQSGALRQDALPDSVAQLLLAAVLGVEVAADLDLPHDASGVGQLVITLLTPS